MDKSSYLNTAIQAGSILQKVADLVGKPVIDQDEIDLLINYLTPYVVAPVDWVASRTFDYTEPVIIGYGDCICGAQVTSTVHTFCNKCGRSLDWSRLDTNVEARRNKDFMNTLHWYG